jgi:hypothetical protein
MKHIKLFEDFKENEPAVIVDQLKEIDKVYQYLFKYDNKLKNRFEIDTTNITNFQGVNYWYNINLFEYNKEHDPIYYWKIFINITLKDLIEKPEVPAPSPEETAIGEETPGVGGVEGASPEEGVEEPVPEEEELYIGEAATKDENKDDDIDDEDDEDDKTPDELHKIKSKIETAYIKLTKYDYETHKKLGEFEDNIKTNDLFNVTWLLNRFKDVDKHILKIPNSQKDVDKTKKHLKNFTDIHYQ